MWLEANYFFIFAIIVAQSNQMEEDYLLGAGYTFCFVITCGWNIVIFP